MTYPSTPGYARNSETSKEAAEKLTSRDELRGLIIKHLSFMAYQGATVDEAKASCEATTGRSFDRSTVAARFTEMTEEGLIVVTRETRKTPRDRNAYVYLHKDYGPVGTLAKPQRVSNQALLQKISRLELENQQLRERQCNCRIWK